MAKWVEPSISVSAMFSSVVVNKGPARENFTDKLTSWNGGVKQGEVFLLQDSPILYDLILQQKWGY